PCNSIGVNTRKTGGSRAGLYAHEDADKARTQRAKHGSLGCTGWLCCERTNRLFCFTKKRSSGISGKHGVRCKEGYDPWIVRLGPAEESDTLMKTRTRRGHDGHDRTKQIL